MANFKKLLTIFLSASFFVSAAPKKEGADSWIDAVVKQKAVFRSQLDKASMPVESSWMKAKMKAAPISATLKGQDKLVLVTTAGPDGNDWDWGVWANARLIKADGTQVWLDELTPSYEVAGSGSVSRNKNLYDAPLSISGQKYDHGMICHANGVMVFDINKEYVRFEAEVGIDDQSKVGSVFFRILNIFPKEEAKKMLALYPNELEPFSSYVDGMENWLSATDASFEKEVVLKLADNLKNSTFFLQKVKQIEAEKGIDQQIGSYLSLYEQMQQVLQLQSELGWLNIESVRLAFNDMKSRKGFDTAKYQPLFNELESLVNKGFNGIY
ncbi:MAG: NPCBM/NEW2 domain-containing protein, partial [Parabacteroides sp.]|nr:NPCBM/NEW2 domain-containing protein [Parabacteroides sp.]